MKLLLCGHCKDIRAIDTVLTTCRCGKTRAQYREDGWHADIWGDDCAVLGLNWDDVYGLLNGYEVAVHSQGPDHPRVTYHPEAPRDDGPAVG